MVRDIKIKALVFEIYSKMDRIIFPIEPGSLITDIPNCRIMTYSEFAQVNECSVREVIRLCESKSGATHYDTANDRYLILWNRDESGFAGVGRKRWTKAHELGHVILRHLPQAAERFGNLKQPEFEQEADRFAADLLCPSPLFDLLHIQSPVDIGFVFGLSNEASNYRWEEYQRSLRHVENKQWDSDMRWLFRAKMREGKARYTTLRQANSSWESGRRGDWISIWKDKNEED